MRSIAAAALGLAALLSAPAFADDTPKTPPAVSSASEAATDAAIALLKPGAMHFDVQWKSIPLGHAVISLTATGTHGCYRYESVTTPIGAVRWLYGSPREVGLFCIVDGVIRPSHYEYRIDKRPKDSFSLDFDWQTHKVKTVKDGVTTERDLPAVAYDRFDVQQAIRLWALQQPDTTKRSEAVFPTIDDKDINPYRFAILGHEKVETPAGTFDAIRIDRVDSKTRSTHSWIAPTRDDQVVKVESINRGNVELSMIVNQ